MFSLISLQVTLTSIHGMKFYSSLQKLKYDNLYQIVTGIIPKLNLVWFQWQWMAMNFVSICYEITSVFAVFGQPPHIHHVRCSEPCEHFAWNASNLWKTYVQGCTVVKLLQPYYNLEISIWGYIFIQAKLIYDSSTLSASHLKSSSKTWFI